MKKTKRIIKAIVAVITVISVLGFTACSSGKNKSKYPSSAYLIDGSVINRACTDAGRGGVNNIEDFKSWVEDYADTVGKKAKLPLEWNLPENLSSDFSLCSQLWSDSHDIDDVDGRIVSVLLLGDTLKVEAKNDNYLGTQLLGVLDAIHNNERCSMLKDRDTEFTALFGEMTVPDEGFKEAFPKHWKEHGISVESDTMSLISIVTQDSQTQFAYVSYAGVLIDRGDYYLFIEKRGFKQPYQATELKKKDELIKMLCDRNEYTAEDGCEQTLVFENDNKIGEIEAVNKI